MATTSATLTVASASVTELAALVSRRSVNYPCSSAVLMRQAARLLWAREAGNAQSLLRTALAYAEAYREAGHSSCTPARMSFLKKAIERATALAC